MPENDAENAKDLELLCCAAEEAAKTTLNYFGKNPKVWLKSGNSPVSEADFAADKVLKECLLSARPDYGWISEETKDDRPEQKYQRYFVVDPIDGTRGFLSGSRYWCISVAIIENGVPQVGVLDCPANHAVYKAQRGKGASLNNEKLPLLKGHDDELIVSATGKFEARLPDEFKSRVKFAHYLPSLAYRIALAAQGKIDIVLVKPDCHDWDIAAADLILNECGGTICDFTYKKPIYGQPPFKHDFLIAGINSKLENVIEIIGKAKLR